MGSQRGENLTLLLSFSALRLFDSGGELSRIGKARKWLGEASCLQLFRVFGRG